MNCKNCNNPLDEGALFCGFCGARVEQEPAASAAPIPAQSAPTPAAPVSSVPTPAAPASAPAPAPAPVYTAEPAAAPVMTAEPAPAPAPAYIPEPAAAAPAAAVKKKKVHIVPIIIAAVVVLLAIAGALFYFFGRPTLMRLIMGEQRYAISLVTDYVDNVKNNDPIISVVANDSTKTLNSTADLMKSFTPDTGSSVQDALSTIMYGSGVSGENIVLAASELGKVTGGQGMSADLSANIQLDNTLSNALGDNKEFLDSILSMVNSSSVNVSAKSGDSTQFALSAKTNGTDFVTANVYIDENGNAYASVPGILDKPILIKSDVSAAEENTAEPFELDQTKLSAVYDKIQQAWEKAYKNAEFTYESAEFTVGDSEHEKTFKGTCVSVTLGQKDICNFLIDVLNIIKEDSYVVEIVNGFGYEPAYFDYAVEDIIIDIENSIDDDSLDMNLTIDSYVTSDNTPCGFEATMSYRNYGEYQSVTFSSLTAGGNTAVSLTENGTKIVELVSTKIDNASGIFEISVNNSGSGKPVGLKVEYSNIATAQFLGSDVLMGKYDISLNVRSMKDDLSSMTFEIGDTQYDLYSVLSKSKLSIESVKDGDGIKTTYGADVYKLGSGSFTVITKPVSGDIAAAPSDVTNVYSLSDITGAEALEMQLSALNYFKNKSAENASIAAMLDTFGYSADRIDGEIESLEKNKEFYAHYSSYDPENSAYYANSMASDIFTGFVYNDIYDTYALIEGKTFTLKLWFDNDGKLTVIDSGDLDMDLQNVFSSNACQNVYAELCITNGSITGVCTVLTDDPSDLPSKLPNYFNYYDGMFEFDSLDTDDYYSYVGIKDGFIIGSNKSMNMGTSETEQRVSEKTALAEKYNEAAKKAYEDFNKFMQSHGASLDPEYSVNYQILISSDGTVHANENIKPLDSIFTKELDAYKDQLFSAIRADIDVDNISIIFVIENGKLLGVTVEEGEIYSAVTSLDFKIGCTDKWSFAQGVTFNDYSGEAWATGTYPLIPSADNATIMDKALDVISGEWYVDYCSAYDVDRNSVVNITKEEMAAQLPKDAYVIVSSNQIMICNSVGYPIFIYDPGYSGNYILTQYFTDAEGAVRTNDYIMYVSDIEQ